MFSFLTTIITTTTATSADTTTATTSSIFFLLKVEKEYKMTAKQRGHISFISHVVSKVSHFFKSKACFLSFRFDIQNTYSVQLLSLASPYLLILLYYFIQIQIAREV